MSEKFKFDPLKFGYRPLSTFHQLMDVGAAEWYGNPDELFVKVTVVNESYGRLMFWYSACRMNTGSKIQPDLIKFYSHSYDQHLGERNFQDGPHLVYSGLISTEEFAVALLCHLFAALDNESVKRFGRMRFERDLRV